MSGEDITGRVIRANWPQLLAFAFVLVAGVTVQLQTTANTEGIASLRGMMSTEAVSEYMVWNNSVETRLEDLEKTAEFIDSLKLWQYKVNLQLQQNVSCSGAN